jgi:hypothetical protein
MDVDRFQRDRGDFGSYDLSWLRLAAVSEDLANHGIGLTTRSYRFLPSLDH